MKQLLVVRHAKSSWAEVGQKDFDRPLNDRGKKDAPAMGERLLNHGIKINAFVSSPAKRALQTCKAIMEAYGRNKSEIILMEKLYHAPSPVYFEAITDFDDAHDTVAVFGHNPGITDFVNSLSETQVDNMPTCAVFAVKAAVKNWKEFEGAEKEFLFFKTPKD